MKSEFTDIRLKITGVVPWRVKSLQNKFKKCLSWFSYKTHMEHYPIVTLSAVGMCSTFWDSLSKLQWMCQYVSVPICWDRKSDSLPVLNSSCKHGSSGNITQMHFFKKTIREKNLNTNRNGVCPGIVSFMTAYYSMTSQFCECVFSRAFLPKVNNI